MNASRLSLVFLVLASMTLTSCLGSGEGSSSTGGTDCGKEVVKTVQAEDIHGDSHLYFPMDKLDFLFTSSGFVLEDVDLSAVLSGKHTPDESLDLDMNGIKMSRNDGKSSCERMDRDDADDSSEGHFKLRNFALNGGLPFELFLAQLRINKGRVDLHIHTKNARLKTAALTFKGKTGACPTPVPVTPPPPTPQPKPVAVTTITAVTPAVSPTSSSNISIAFSADQTGVTFWCALDSAVFAKCATPQAYIGLSNGSHQFRVYSQNSAGVDETPGVVYNWTVDLIAPTVTIANAAQLPGLTNLDAMSFQLAASEAGTFKCSLDGAAFSACPTPQVYSALPEGPHTFAVQAIDGVGNVSGQPASFNWTIDLTAPVLSIVNVSPFAGISNVNQRTIEFSATETANFQCSLDGTAFSACQSPLALTNLSEGNHLMQIAASDLAGNAAATVSVAWTNDYTAPVLTLGNIAPAAGLTNAKSLAVEFSANEPATLYCVQDSGAPTACLSPLVWSALPDGNHQVQIYGVDLAGNPSATAILNWTVDSTAPLLSFNTIAPSSAQYLNQSDVTFNMNVSENSALSATLNGVAVAAANPLALSRLADGAYTLSLIATDPAGNVSAPLTHDFVIDTVVPVLTLSSDDARDPTNLDHRSLSFSTSEAVTYLCNADNQGFSACQSPLPLSGLADGTHLVVVQAIDLAGNSTQASAQWTVDTHAPTTTLTAVQQNTTITFTFNADESATFKCALDGAVASTCTSPLTLSGLAPGLHNFVVWATDLAQNIALSGASFPFSVAKPIVTSITASTPAANLTNQTTVSFTFQAEQPASGYLCSLDGGAAVACTSPKTYSGLADGAHNFVVKAIDTWGVADVTGARHNWTVDTIAPTVSGITATATTNSITVTWVSSEGSTDQVLYGVGFTVTQQTVESAGYVTSHSVRLTGLSSNTTYSYQVYGRDAAGNSYVSTARTVRTSR